MGLLDFLFPAFCVSCGRLGSSICKRCESMLRPVRIDRCLYCRKPSLFGLTHPGCQRKHGIDGMVTLFYYNSVTRAVIGAIKYRTAYTVLTDFFLLIPPESAGKLLCFKRFHPSYFLQPIPLHPHKLRTRGFNQSEMIGRFVDEYTGYDVINVLSRLRDTKAQATLSSRHERAWNMRRVFAIREEVHRIKDRPIILIDDVVTSGSTVKEACATLKRAGVKKVFVFALALG